MLKGFDVTVHVNQYGHVYEIEAVKRVDTQVGVDGMFDIFPEGFLVCKDATVDKPKVRRQRKRKAKKEEAPAATALADNKPPDKVKVKRGRKPKVVDKSGITTKEPFEI
jgi:hypothetical protein